MRRLVIACAVLAAMAGAKMASAQQNVYFLDKLKAGQQTGAKGQPYAPPRKEVSQPGKSNVTFKGLPASKQPVPVKAPPPAPTPVKAKPPAPPQQAIKPKPATPAPQPAKAAPATTPQPQKDANPYVGQANQFMKAVPQQKATQK